MGGMALKMVTSKLGVPNASLQKVEQILEDEPEKASLIQEADREFADKIKELEINLEAFKVETEDRQDARRAFKEDITFAEIVDNIDIYESQINLNANKMLALLISWYKNRFTQWWFFF